MLKLFISNQIEQLSEQLSKEYAQSRQPFLKEYIVLQTKGMEQWLSVQIAEQTGAFANFEYSKPNAFIHLLYQWADIPVHQVFSTENLKWLLFKFLNEDEFIQRFPNIALYYENNPSKRLMLSVKMADLFDQYLLYRQEYIEEWNRGEKAQLFSKQNLSPKEIEDKQRRLDQHQAWQAYLWQRIKSFLPEGTLDQVEQKKQLIERLKEVDFQNKILSKLSRISLFGLSVITEYHVEIFYQLSRFVDVHLYFINPSPETYWYDNISDKFALYIERKTGSSLEDLKLEVGNEFLNQYSKLAKDTFNILFANDDFVNAIDDHTAIAPAKKTLLNKIQNDIYFNLNEHKNPIETIDLKDKSLLISSSYTLMREVEALYQQLLWYFDHKEDLQAHDIVVYVTQIENYAPYIKAVFEQNEANIPYIIADKTYTQEHSLFNLVEELLNLDSENFTPENVLYLLSYESVREQFGIENIELIREVLKTCNIHFGIDGKEEDESYLVSWTYGLERLLLGYAIKGEPLIEQSSKALYPIDRLEGQEYNDLFRFKHFTDLLIQFIKQKNTARNLKDWSLVCRRFFSQCIAETGRSPGESRSIEKQLLSIEDMSDTIDELIEFDLFKKAFLDALFNNIKSTQFVTGKITFSSMIPLRSIPFKVVAVLGLNYNDFPRKESKTAFDLIDIEYKRGDRNPKNNDKYLFLELLLSVRENLYLSYIGSSIADNTEIPPSLVIEEVIHYIEASCSPDISLGDIEKELIKRHPLHAFSQKYNQETTGLIRYRVAKETDFKEMTSRKYTKETELDEQTESLNSCSPSELFRFFKNTFKSYFNKQLQVYYSDEEESISETELFELNKLEEYWLKTDLLKLNPRSILKLKSDNALPLSNYGTLTHQNKELLITDLQEKIAEDFDISKIKNQAITKEWNGHTWSEIISNIEGERCFRIELGSSSGANLHLFRTWLQHVFLIAAGQPKDSYTYSLYMNEKEIPILPKELLTQEEARNYLDLLFIYLNKGRQQVVLFHFSSSLAWVKHLVKKKKNEIELKQETAKKLKNIKENSAKSKYSHQIYCPYTEKVAEQGLLDPSDKSIAEFMQASEDILGLFVEKIGVRV